MSRLEQLKKLASNCPGDPLAHYALGIEHLNLAQWDAAIAAFDAAARADPKYSPAYYHKARAEIGAGRPELARQTLARGMEVARTAGDWHTEGEMQALLESIA